MKSKIPEGMTEAEVLEIIEKVSDKLAYKYMFGYHTHKDIKQQAFIEAWKGLDTYDASRPLENFLWIHVRNRLHNFKRDNFQRPDLPCKNCPLKAYNPNCSSGCDLYSDKSECDLYRNWAKRNTPKKNIINTIDIDNIDDERESNMSKCDKIGDEIDKSQIFTLIDAELPIYLRPYYIKWKAGCKIPKQYRDEIKSTIQKILKDHDINPEETW